MVKLGTFSKNENKLFKIYIRANKANFWHVYRCWKVLCFKNIN